MAFVVIAATVALWLGSRSRPGGDPRTLVPAVSRLAVVIDSVEAFKKPVADYLAGIEGSKGIYDLVNAYVGLDLAGEGGLEAIGLSPETGLVCFEKEGAIVLAAGVSATEAFMDNVRQRIRMFGPASTTGTASDAIHVAQGPTVEGVPGWSIAWGVTADRIGLVVWVGQGADAREAWESASEAPQEVMARPDGLEQAGLWAAGDAGGLEVELPIPVVGKLIKRALNSTGRWHVGVEVDRETLRLSTFYPSGRALQMAAPITQTTEPVVDFAAYFPKGTSFFSRSRVRVEEAGMLLTGLVMAAPEPVWVDGLPMPALATLLEGLTGEIAVAVMGMDPAVQPTELAAQFNSLGALLQGLHTAVAVEARDEAAATRLFQAMKSGARARGFETVSGEAAASSSGGDLAFFSMTKEVDGPAIRGRRAATPRSHHYSLLRQGRVLIFLTGKGELRRFLGVHAGTASPLASAAVDAHMRGVLQGGDHALAFVLMSARITRELASKGFPPFILTVVNSIREVAGTVTLVDGGLTLVVEARQ